MAVIVMRKQRLSYLISTDGYEDENGDYHEGTSMWRGYIPCNAVPAGKAAEIPAGYCLVCRGHTAYICTVFQ